MKRLLIITCLIMLCFGCSNQEDLARKSYNKAMQLERQGHVEDAKQLYELIIKKYPSTQVAVEVNKMLISKENNFNRLSDIFKTDPQNKQMISKTQIELLGLALDDFYLDAGRYPTTEEGLEALRKKPEGLDDWDGPYLPQKGVPKDLWLHNYVYKSPGEHGHYDLMSYGRDAQPGGEGEDADIVSWR